jgi:hypothetical protein
MKHRIIVIAIIALTAGVLYAANELTVIHNMAYSKGGVVVTIAETKTITINVAGYLDSVVTVSTNESQYSFGVITNAGVVFIKNLSAVTNVDVLVGSTQGVYAVRCKPFESWPIRLEGTNLFLKATTNSTLVRVAAFPN